MPENIRLAVVSNIHDSAVFRIKLTDRVVTSDAAILTESDENLVLQFCFGVYFCRLLVAYGYRYGYTA